MKISIVESEIKEAITNHIMSQMVIREGMRIDIDIAATRGEDGFTAEIKIVPQERTGAVLVQVEPEKKPAVTAEAPAVKRTYTRLAADTATAIGAAPAPAVVATQAIAVPATVMTGVVEKVADTPTSNENVLVTATAEIAAATEMPAPKKSLFGNLPAPRNS